jgi:hypothetical protein
MRKGLAYRAACGKGIAGTVLQQVSRTSTQASIVNTYDTEDDLPSTSFSDRLTS